MVTNTPTFALELYLIIGVSIIKKAEAIALSIYRVTKAFINKLSSILTIQNLLLWLYKRLIPRPTKLLCLLQK